MSKIKELLDAYAVYAVVYHEYPIPEAKDALDATRTRIMEEVADIWDDGARRAGRYGHEDGWYGGGPHRDNPFRSEQEIIDIYGEDEDGYW